MVNNWLQNAQAWVFPTYCLLCGAKLVDGIDLCPACRRSLPYIDPGCPRCANPGTAGNPCGECQQRPPIFDRTRAPFGYSPPINQLIRGLKYHRRLNYARMLGELLAAHLECLPGPPPELIVPVPLHRSRLRSRGYNQALEIARPVVRKLGIELDFRSACRIRATAPQIELSPKERRGNVRGAFITHPLAARRVAILDDVMTTGHTANELARCLRRAGAEHIEVWVVARA